MFLKLPVNLIDEFMVSLSGGGTQRMFFLLSPLFATAGRCGAPQLKWDWFLCQKG